MGNNSMHSARTRQLGSRRRALVTVVLATAVATLGSPIIPSAAQAAPPAGDESTRRIGVLALAGAISAVGQTDALASPLPYSDVSLSEVLQLDEKLTQDLTTALAGTDLEAGLELIEGITVLDDSDPDRISFTYDRAVADHDLELVYDDGDLRFGENDGAGTLDVSLTTRDDRPFVIEVDEDQADPLLRVALVSQPVMDLSVDVETDALTPFSGRQGFTEVDVTGGHYRIHRDQVITMRDPDGRGVLTLEDLRYSTLPDLFRIEFLPDGDEVDIAFDLALPDSLPGGSGAEREGTMSIDEGDTPTGGTWPDDDADDRVYGDALAQATDLTVADGLAGLAQYTGTTLALQDAAEVSFPQLGGGTTDLFAPGDRLVELVSSAAAAQIQCGAAPDNPPSGAALPGDTVYCIATSADGLGELEDVVWSTNQDGTVASDADVQAAATGAAPTDVVRIDGSDGEPDVSVTFTSEGQSYTARSMPMTVQDVVDRISELGSASAELRDSRLDVSVSLEQATAEKELEVGNPATLGALVGLTGLQSASGDPATATATATDSSYDVGFAISTGPVAETEARRIWLLPQDESLLRIGGLTASAPVDAATLPARIGFLGVDAKIDSLSLGKVDDAAAAVVMTREDEETGPILISDVLNTEGVLDPDLVGVVDNVTAGISFTANELPISGSTYATGGSQKSGTATVRWTPGALPDVSFGGDYATLRIFDPVPATFLSGTAAVTPGDLDGEDGVAGTEDDGTQPDVVRLDLPEGTDLYDQLGGEAPADGEPAVEIARRMMAAGLACQNVTIVDADSLTCEGLAPNGYAGVADGATLDVIVVGDPFVLRDSVIEGLSRSMATLDGQTDDGLPADGFADDQFSSSLPLVDLVAKDLADERQALRNGLSKLVSAAAEDELPVQAGGTLPSVSSAQALSNAIAGLVKVGNDAFAGTIGYTTTGGQLGVTLSATRPTSLAETAALRFSVDPIGQVVGATKVPVSTTSTTTLDVDIDTASAYPTVAGDTGTVSTAAVALGSGSPSLDHKKFQAGIGQYESEETGSDARLGVRVITDYVLDGDGVGHLETRRENTRTGGVKAATATLKVTEDGVTDAPVQTVTYAADATDSSGGTGAGETAPERMMVKYAAEGLDGLATAVELALDGSAPRNVDATGKTATAPLIGANLDAGAGVATTMRTLTSSLRTQLATIDADDADALVEDLVAKVGAADTATSGLSLSGTTATVTCDADGTACDDDDIDDDSATGWHTVTIRTTLEGESKTSQTPFETGLEGLELRSDYLVDTTTSWELPVTLQLVRGTGPQIVVESGQALRLDVDASLPSGFKAIVGYLPATITAAGETGKLHTQVVVDPADRAYNLFDLYDGKLTARPTFADKEVDDSVHDEQGIDLTFDTLAGDAGAFDLSGTVKLPWTAEGGFGTVAYNNVELDVGEVAKSIATPFRVVDPYLAPVRSVMNVLRTPLPVVSTVSELAGKGEISMLSLLGTIANGGKKRPKLELAYRVIGLVDGVTKTMNAIASFDTTDNKISLSDLNAAGDALQVQPQDLYLNFKCTRTVKSANSGGSFDCPDSGFFSNESKKKGVFGQMAADNRKGKRAPQQNISQKTKQLVFNTPGFSLPFMSEPDQLMDLITGEGEASYFRLDLGELTATVAYAQRIGPIMAGPIPIVPFIGGSIAVSGRLAMGFDSHPQTLAWENLSHPGDVDGLEAAYEDFKDSDVITQGFYVDDLDGQGVDVPEVKLVTTLYAGASISIGVVSAGIKGGVTLTMGLDLNDPDGDGRLRTAEIADVFTDNPACLFTAKATIEAFIAVFVEIDLLLTSFNYDYKILELGPYTIFNFSCPTVTPTLVKLVGSELALTSGSRNGDRNDSRGDVSDEYEVRQFDTGGGAVGGGTSEYEITAFGRVQRVTVAPSGSGYAVTVYESGITTSTTPVAGSDGVVVSSYPTFVADGGAADDKLSFLTGETVAQASNGDLAVKTTPFDTRVSNASGGIGDDLIVTGEAADYVTGGDGDDTLDLGAGDDKALGGIGSDIISGGAGRDDLLGEGDGDRLSGGPGADRAYGGDGTDSLVGGPGRDVRATLVLPEDETDDADDDNVPDVVETQVRDGFDSGDVLIGGAGGDVVDGGDGSDVVIGGEQTSLSSAALGSLFTDAPRTVDVLVEGSGLTNPTPTTLQVDSAVVPSANQLDTYCASGDPVSGAASNDFVTGGAESDVVVGGNGPDQLDGGSGPDDVCGRAGDDQLSGDGAQPATGDDVDVVRGGHGDDRIDGGPGGDVMYGDDVTLVRAGTEVLDGSLGGAANSSGTGADYLDGGEGDDLMAGGLGSDLLLGSEGDDLSFGEGRDTVEQGGTAPSLSDRLLGCNLTTRIIRGKVDLDGDLLAGVALTDITPDNGQLAGLEVALGVLQSPISGVYEGLLGDEVVVGGLVDLDRDGVTGEADDTGVIALPSAITPTATNTNGDCILSGDGDDELVGGAGSDYLGSGEGTDLTRGGDGNDLLLGDGGVDVVLGGPHHDVLVGGTGDDALLGEDGDDRLRGNEGADDLVGGSDTAAAADGQDVLLGGRENDVLAAENAAPVSLAIQEAVTATVEVPDSDPVTTVADVPWSAQRDGETGAQYLRRVPASVVADEASPLRFADSALACDGLTQDRWLTILRSDGVAGVPAQSPGTPLAYDELYGGYDCDFVFGSTGDDLVRGGQDDDVVEGGPGGDLAYGDDGDDVVIGGSSLDHTATTAVQVTTGRSGAGVRDGNDTVLGDGGPDAMDGNDIVAGDNAHPRLLTGTPGLPGPGYTVRLHDQALAGATAPSAQASGADTLDGGGMVDQVFGQGGNDTASGGTGDDHVEGNAGNDTVNGGDGDDDLIGGSSTNDGWPLGEDGTRMVAVLDAMPYDASAAGAVDGADTLEGGAGRDVALGDNGRITRPTVPTPAVRDIALVKEAASALATTTGTDTLRGGADGDRLYGQDGNDQLDAGSGDDYLEGNAGTDTALGAAGSDTVIGGSSVSPAGEGQFWWKLPTLEMPDAADVLYGDEGGTGNAGSDLIAGDNATLIYAPPSARPVLQLHSVPTSSVPVGSSGGDTIFAGGPLDGSAVAGDRIFGQSGNDTITGAGGVDYVEGNAGADLVRGNGGDDMVIGGSSSGTGRPLGDEGTRLTERMDPRADSSAGGVLDEADEVRGGEGNDTVLGDNGRITRPTDGQAPALDVAMAETSGADTRHGSDNLYGDGGDDVLYGQLDDGSSLEVGDQVWATGDRLEGGDGHDALLGDLAVVSPAAAEQLGSPTTLRVSGQGIREDVYERGTTVYQTWVPQGTGQTGGPDLAVGGAGNDTLRLGGGVDLGNGQAGRDTVFGGDANDALWGGTDHDRILGGYGDDDLDLKLRSTDPAAYNLARGTEDRDNNSSTTNGADLVYGGWGHDELQADVGSTSSPADSDYLVDWVGDHNLYYRCGTAGPTVMVKDSTSGWVSLFKSLADAVGTRERDERLSGGWLELGLVEGSGLSDNSSRTRERAVSTCG